MANFLEKKQKYESVRTVEYKFHLFAYKGEEKDGDNKTGWISSVE